MSAMYMSILVCAITFELHQIIDYSYLLVKNVELSCLFVHMLVRIWKKHMRVRV